MRTSAPDHGLVDVTTHGSSQSPRLSVIMSTYNRGNLLADAVRSVLAQQSGPAFELIVVDNNSTDDTREIVARIAGSDGRVHYAFEPRQGLSYARNTGLVRARAPLVAFTDDDVRVEADWVAAIVRTFEEYPNADVVGGPVLPIWQAPPPAWLTRDHWAPLALVDHGDTPVAVTADHQICLIGANVAFRRAVFDVVGGFGIEFQRVKDGIGSLEDHEFLTRLLRAGRTGLYHPRIVVHAEVQPNRLSRTYHRRWHTGHGQFHALLRLEHMERTRAGTLFGVPLHLYRQALGSVAGWVRTQAAGDPSAAFQHEARLRFFAGFLTRRRGEFLDRPRHEQIEELRSLFRRFVARRPALMPSADARVGERQG